MGEGRRAQWCGGSRSRQWPQKEGEGQPQAWLSSEPGYEAHCNPEDTGHPSPAALQVLLNACKQHRKMSYLLRIWATCEGLWLGGKRKASLHLTQHRAGCSPLHGHIVVPPSHPPSQASRHIPGHIHPHVRGVGVSRDGHGQSVGRSVCTGVALQLSRLLTLTCMHCWLRLTRHCPIRSSSGSSFSFGVRIVPALPLEGLEWRYRYRRKWSWLGVWLELAPGRVQEAYRMQFLFWWKVLIRNELQLRHTAFSGPPSPHLGVSGVVNHKAAIYRTLTEC